MATFQFKAKRDASHVESGFIEAESRFEALEKITRRGFYPLAVFEFRKIRTSSFSFGRSVSNKQLSLFTRQLSDLLESHIPLWRALEIIHRQTTNRSWQNLVRAVQDEILGGKSLSESLKNFPQQFSAIYVNLVRAGEAGEMLDKILGRLAAFLDQEDDFKSRISAAIVYPMLIATVGAITVIFLMVFVVPRLSSMFLDSGEHLPWMAQVLTTLSDALRSATGLSLIIGFLALMTWMLVRLPQTTKIYIKNLLFKVPVWGAVLKKAMLARFARTLSMLLSGGVPILDALPIVSGVLEHPLFQQRINDVAIQVREGIGFSQALNDTRLFPEFVCQMIGTGEETNTLESSLDKVATAYDRDTDRAMKLATSLIEPVMILGVGSVIGVIVIGMLLPVFQISTFVK